MLGIWTRVPRMIGADGSTDLWRPPWVRFVRLKSGFICETGHRFCYYMLQVRCWAPRWPSLWRSSSGSWKTATGSSSPTTKETLQEGCRKTCRLVAKEIVFKLFFKRAEPGLVWFIFILFSIQWQIKYSRQYMEKRIKCAWDLNLGPLGTLTVGGRITVWLISSFTRLYSSNQKNMLLFVCSNLVIESKPGKL